MTLLPHEAQTYEAQNPAHPIQNLCQQATHFLRFLHQRHYRKQVIGELTVPEKEGWEVFSVDPHFVIKVHDATTLWLLPHGETHCQIQPESTLGQARPTTTRLVAGQPASNVAPIQTLIGSAEVEAVHDPYLADKGLDTLRILFRLGVHYGSLQ